MIKRILVGFGFFCCVACQTYSGLRVQDINKQGLVIIPRQSTSMEQLKARVHFLDDLTKDQHDPYTGRINSVTNCFHDQAPAPLEQETANEFVSVHSAHASAQRVFGACTDAKTGLHAQIVLIQCKEQNKAFEVHYFYPRTEQWIATPVVSCSR